MNPSPPPVIELREVQKIYHCGESEVRALDSISLSVYPGEFVAVMGRSGSGKSTFLNMVGCLDQPDAGQVLLEGRDVTALGERQLSRIRGREIGFIFQGFHLLPELSAYENVELPLLYRWMHAAERHARVMHSLAEVDLLSRIRHLPSEMSGGQQQRVAIARALAGDPPLILADEPTGNLDSVSGGEVIDLLVRLWKQGKTILLITHDPVVAAAAGRIVRVGDGRIVPS